MSRLRGVSRRSILRLAAALFAGAGLRTVSAAKSGYGPEFGTLAESQIDGLATWASRNYNINATILLGSFPVMSKDEVGGACLALELAKTDDDSLTGLQFVAGTWPDRVKGFNRFGATQELVSVRANAVRESAYTCFMSTSSEKGFADGRRAVTATGPESMFSIARGRSTPDGCAFELRHRPASARLNWSDCIGLLHAISDWGPLPNVHPLPDSPPCALPTFLFATRRALRTNQPVLYNHNGAVYRLIANPQPADGDEQMTVCHLSKIGERREVIFRLWFKSGDDSGFPARIEFHPKSFLKLTLTENTSTRNPVLRPILGEIG